MLQVREARVNATMNAKGITRFQAIDFERSRNAICEGFRRNTRFGDHRFDNAEPEVDGFADRLRAFTIANMESNA